MIYIYIYENAERNIGSFWQQDNTTALGVACGERTRAREESCSFKLKRGRKQSDGGRPQVLL